MFHERAQVAHRPGLEGEAQSIMRTALLCDQPMVGVVQVEIPGEVVGRRRAAVVAVVFALVVREKADWHEC